MTMKRTIKFRGKRVDKGEWVYGDLLQWLSKGKCAITPQNGSEWSNPYDFEVIPETVCQFTGLTDKNGKEIYEGDVIIHAGRNGGKPHSIVYDLEKAAFCGSYGLNYPLQSGEFYSDQIEVIGNIHDK